MWNEKNMDEYWDGFFGFFTIALAGNACDWLMEH